VYLYDNYAPDCLLCFTCGLLFYLRLRYGMSPLVQSRYDPVSHGQTPPSFNCPLPLVYLTRLRLPYCTPRPPFSSESPCMPLARQPLSLLVTEWHEFLSVSPVVQMYPGSHLVTGSAECVLTLRLPSICQRLSVVPQVSATDLKQTSFPR
jgi:hypothetical protein